jgi:hydroxyacylglutathione hydrolase
MEGQTSRLEVRQIPHMGFSNAYIVETGEDKLILIDTGTPGKEARVLACLKSIGKKPGDVSDIVLTHPDADHSGSAAKLKGLTGARVAIGELDAPRLAGKMKLKETSGIVSVVMRLTGAFMRVERIEPDTLLKDGDTVGPLSVVHTPGHTDGSISIYAPGRFIFVGDLLRTDGSGNLRLASPRMSRNMVEVRRSVERVSGLDFEALLPGHGKPLEQEASKKLREFVSNGFR